MIIYIKKLMMMKNNLTLSNFAYIFFIAFSFVTLGCSSTDTSLKYYSLNAIESQQENVKTIEKHEGNIFVVIDRIELADFLNTGGLVMQIDSHQINISNQHRWGDKLPKAISTHLIASLSNKENKLYVESKNSNNSRLADKYLSLSFEQFTVTNQVSNSNNETVISGTYIIETTNADKHIDRRKTFFDIRQPLTQDGYNHAVENFKASLNTLSKQIQNDIQSSQ